MRRRDRVLDEEIVVECLNKELCYKQNIQEKT